MNRRRAEPLVHLASVTAAVLVAAVIVLHDLGLPALWSAAIGLAIAGWLALMLWAARPAAGRARTRRARRHSR